MVSNGKLASALLALSLTSVQAINVTDDDGSEAMASNHEPEATHDAPLDNHSGDQHSPEAYHIDHDLVHDVGVDPTM